MSGPDAKKNVPITQQSDIQYIVSKCSPEFKAEIYCDINKGYEDVKGESNRLCIGQRPTTHQLKYNISWQLLIGVFLPNM